MDAEAPTVPEPSPARQQIETMRREMEDMDVDEDLLRDEDGEMLEEVEDDGGLAESDEEDLPAVQDDSSLKFDKHEDAVYCVAVSKGGAILSGGGDDRAWLQPAPMGSRGAICLEGHNDSVTACGFSHQDSMCATGAYDGSVKLWDTASGRLLRTLEGPGDVEWLEGHPKGDVVLCGACDGTLWMWLATSGACMRVFAGHDGAVLCGGFTCDGKKIVSGSADGSLRVWNPRKGQCAHAFLPHKGSETDAVVMTQGAVSCIAFHPSDPDLVLGGAEDGCAAVIHCSSKKVLCRLEHSPPTNDEEAGAAVVSVAFAESGWCSTGAADGTLKVWDISGSARLRCSLGAGGAIVAMAWRPSSLVVVACSADGCIHAWDARDGSSLMQLRGHSDAPLCLATAWAQDAIVTAGDDRTVRVFRVPSADLPRPPPGSAPAPAPAPRPPMP